MSKSSKDLFSGHADIYAKYRPLYPKELYDFLFSHVKHHEAALDCGTGNGQCAATLADHFKSVDGIDISKNQLERAIQKPNLRYHVSSAEATPFDDNTFDLVTAATATHWFKFNSFYKEVKRVAKNEAVFACWAYHIVRTDNVAINEVIDEFYWHQVHDYWDPERKYVEEQYQTIPFPFEEIPNHGFKTVLDWDLNLLEGYLNTWSAVQKYLQQHTNNPVSDLVRKMKEEIGENQTLKMTFPIFMRIGIIRK